MNQLNWDLENQIGEWSKYLSPLFFGEKMYNLYQEFKVLPKGSLTPLATDIFKWLRVCPPKDLKVIMVAMDSYPGRYKNGVLQATGIPLDCSNSPDGTLQPSLETFYEELEKEYEEKFVHFKDLTYLCSQGVLLGNRALNCKVGVTGSMMGKWDFFWKFFLEEVISSYFPGIPIVLIGKDAQILKRHVFEMLNPVFMIEHPSAAARANRYWETKGIFKAINKIIEENNGEEFKIKWNYGDYECPF